MNIHMYTQLIMECDKCKQYYIGIKCRWCIHSPKIMAGNSILLFEKELITTIIEVFVKSKLPKDIIRLLLCRTVYTCGINYYRWLNSDQQVAYERWLQSVK